MRTRTRRCQAFLAVVLLAISLQCANAYAEDSLATEYSVLYGGNGDDYDAHRFSYRLYYLGANGTWTGATQSSNMAGEQDVNHWDVTTGYAGVDPYPGGNQRDLLYLSTHGSSKILTFWDPSVSSNARERDQNGRSDNVGPKLGTGDNYYNETVNWEIGSDYIATNKTSSRWDNDTEWIVLAACTQLSTKGDSRKHYARTLLGDPQRAHMILGYDTSTSGTATSPGDLYDWQIVDRFFDYIEARKSVRYSWLLANKDINIDQADNAAVVTHKSNENELLPPIGTATVDSASGSVPTLKYWYIPSMTSSTQPASETSGSVVPDEPVSEDMTPTARLDGVIQNWFASAAAGVLDLFGTADAFAAPVVRGRDTTYLLDCELPEAAGEVPLISIEPETALRPEKLTDGEAVQTPSFTPDDLAVRYRGKDVSLAMYENGAVRVSKDGEPKDRVNISSDHAVSVARQYISQHGGMPKDAKAVKVSTIRCADMDVEDGNLSNDVAVAHIVSFGRSVDGRELSGNNGDHMTAVVTDDGVVEYSRLWRQVTGRAGSVKILSASDAFEGLADEGERSRKMSGSVEVVNVELVYHAPSARGNARVFRPAWRFTLGDGSRIHLDAQSGKCVD